MGEMVFDDPTQQMTASQALRIASRHHAAADFAQAEAIYRQILAQAPEPPLVLHELGVLYHQLGRNDPAAELLGRAVKLAPGNASWHAHLAEVLRHLGRIDEAIDSYR